MEEQTRRIRALNDSLRTTFIGGRVVMTAGVIALPEQCRTDALTAVRQFSDFSDGNDPYGEHDFGAFEIDGERFFWKIDYYDKQQMYGSEDPSDPAQTLRVLTIMLADEY